MGLKPSFPKQISHNIRSDKLRGKTTEKATKPPKQRGSKVVKYLTEEEIARLFSVITSRRDRALFAIAYFHGLRASEMGILQLSDLRLTAGRVYITRLKGSHSGEFRLLDRELPLLRAWARDRGREPGPLFPSRNHKPICRQMLDVLFKKYGALANLPATLRHWHVLKHSCGTHLLARCGDVALVQDWLGHANIQSTLVYSQVTNRRRDELADKVRGW